MKIHIAPRFSARTDIRLLREVIWDSASQGDDLLFKKPGTSFNYPELVSSALPQADCIVIPQSIRGVNAATESYLEEQVRLGKAHGKRVLAWIGGDFAHRIHIDREGLVVFTTMYGKTRRKNEIAAAPFVQDLLESEEILLRKKSVKPSVSFCGYAGFPSIKTRIVYVIKNILLECLAYLTGRSHFRVYKRGIYFRRAAMRALAVDPRIETRFITRNTFSGNRTTIALDPTVARTEYVENMRDSDFVLAPKGDGNFSNRFYEALSMGRIPILIDTDMVLPLEGVVDYEKCILRVPYTDLHRLGDIVTNFYDSLSDEAFIAMQQAARAAFVNYLRHDSFYRYALPRVVSGELP